MAHEQQSLTFGELRRAGAMLGGLEVLLRSEQADLIAKVMTTGLKDDRDAFGPLADEPPDLARAADDVAAMREVLLTTPPTPLLEVDRAAGDALRDAFAILQAYASEAEARGLGWKVVHDALDGREPAQVVDALAQVGLMGFQLLAERSGVAVTELLGSIGRDVAAGLAEAGE